MAHWPKYHGRTIHDLDGVWSVSFLGDVDTDGFDVSSIAWNDRLSVPGCFDADTNYVGKRGVMAEGGGRYGHSVSGWWLGGVNLLCAGRETRKRR